MREENYFKIKLANSQETLLMAKSKLEHLDIQMNLLELRFEHDKKVYNDQVIHMQKIVVSMEKRIPELEKKIAQGYTTIDMRTGKAYKSFTDRHVGLLKDKIKKSEEQQKSMEKAYKEKQSLKKKKRTSLTPKQLDTVIADEVREEAQPKDELKTNRDKEMERLKLKEVFYRVELEKLKKEKAEPKVKEVKFDSVGNEVLKDLLEELVPPEEEVIEEVELDPIDEHEGKEQCPECKDWFTKGGAFARHYQSHFNGD